ncbi:MAG: hypothetical protein WAT79_00045 [Saprospiraceae bacterium]
MREFKIHISFIVLLMAINYVSAQNVIEIEVDSIHCNDSTCHLLNFSEDQIYSCSFLSLELAAYRYNQTIECSYDRKLNVARETSNTLNLKKITTLKEFKLWVSNLNLASNFSNNGMKFKEQFQALNERHGVIVSENLESRDKNKIGIYQITPILINSEYYVAGLIRIDDYEVEHLIFPDKNKASLMHYFNRLYLPASNTYEIDQKELYKDIFRTYKVRNFKSKKVLTNSISSDPILDGEYDDIILNYPFIVTKVTDNISIYDETLRDITPNNLIEAYQSFGSLQLIIDNEVKWINSEKMISDTMPKIERVLDCGNVPCQEKSIINSNHGFVEIIRNCEYTTFDNSSTKDSVIFDLNRNLQSIKYLNNKTNRIFSVDCFMEFYCNPTNLFYFKTENNSQGIFKRVDEKQETIDKIWANKSLSHQEQWKLVKPIRDSLEVSYRDEILFEGNFEDIILSDYNKPIVFKENGNYGIFPLMQKAKYKSIKPFIGNFAEVVFKNNDEGWIDLNGKEIRKKGN